MKPFDVTAIVFVNDRGFAESAGGVVRQALIEAGDFYPEALISSSYTKLAPQSLTWQSQVPPTEAVADYRFHVGYLGPVVAGSPDDYRATDAEIEQIWAKIPTRAGRADQEVVAKVVRSRTEPAGDLVVVTDAEIQPPGGWNYRIFDRASSGFVVSAAPLDPAYWGEKMSPDAGIGLLKDRTRSAVLHILGTMLGLTRCDNPECFLYTYVDEVSSLDTMRLFGKEHQIPGLTGMGFPPTEEADEAAQPTTMAGWDKS